MKSLITTQDRIGKLVSLKHLKKNYDQSSSFPIHWPLRYCLLSKAETGVVMNEGKKD